jgi:hypothetical protein
MQTLVDSYLALGNTSVIVKGYPYALQRVTSLNTKIDQKFKEKPNDKYIYAK